MFPRVTSIDSIDKRWSWLCKIGAVAALLTGMLLLIGLISLIISVLLAGTTNNVLLPLQNNWLVKIFILHAEFGRIPAELHGLNLLDMVILLLVAILCLSFSTVLSSASKVWPIIAFTLSLIAIIVFAITQIAGRSTVMLAVLINSLVMLRDNTFSKIAVFTGILASIFLFVGDLTVGIHSTLITTIFGLGYLLLTTWFFLIAQNLFRLK